MEKEFDDMLQERLTEAKQIEKAKITNFWKRFGKILENPKKILPSLQTQDTMKKAIQLAKINYLPEEKVF